MNFGVYEILVLAGSLCVFLFGMKLMSESIQKVAGNKLRNFLGKITVNPFMGIVSGITVTAIIQSSSAVTVMLVSFVNAGLLNLKQAVGVIMGANIGTTITGWIVAILGFELDLADISLPLIAISFPLMMSKTRFKSYGEGILGFSILFLGLEMLKDSIPDITEFPHYFQTLDQLSGYGFWSVLIFMLIGAVIVAVIQSSSAGMALTLVMSYNGWIGFHEAAALILGFDLGTTLTANLAATVGNRQAKRAAFAHTMFNVIGIIAVLFVFEPLVRGINSIMIATNMGSPKLDATVVPIGLTIFHTTFNIFNTLIVIGFVKQFVALIERIIPLSDKKTEISHLEYFDSGLLQAAELSIIQARKETKKFAELTKRMSNFTQSLINEPDKFKFEETKERIFKYEEIIDQVEIEITTFLAAISKQQVSDETSEEIRRLRLSCSEIEKIGDEFYKMAKHLAKNREEKATFTEEQRKKITELLNILQGAFDNVLDFLEKGEAYAKENLHKAAAIELSINDFRDAVTKTVIQEFEMGSTTVKSTFVYNKLITSCEKVGDNLYRVSEAIAGVNVE